MVTNVVLTIVAAVAMRSLRHNMRFSDRSACGLLMSAFLIVETAVCFVGLTFLSSSESSGLDISPWGLLSSDRLMCTSEEN